MSEKAEKSRDRRRIQEKGRHLCSAGVRGKCMEKQDRNMGCTLCPRMCHADRAAGGVGFCGAGASLRLARGALHMWEEPCISGTRGSGTVFFSGCQLKCCFCQNYKISHEGFGLEVSEDRLCEILLSLQAQGAHNINFVSGTPYIEPILRVLDRIRGRELHIPTVWNTGGYERVETLRRLDGYIDIYLPDYKYHDGARAARYSSARDYSEIALRAIRDMVRQTGPCRFDGEGLLLSGTVVRHLVMPGGRHDSLACIEDLAACFSPDRIRISLMSQYTPFYKSAEHPEIHRRITTFEYESVCKAVLAHGFDGYFQEKSAAREEYTPPFDLEGIF